MPCETCQYFDLIRTDDKGNGLCRRLPPMAATIPGHPLGMPLWPVVGRGPDWWCGEYLERLSPEQLAATASSIAHEGPQ